MLQGIADGELWTTSATSNLLTRNGGRPTDLGRLQLWGAYEPLHGLVFYAQGRLEGGGARADTANPVLQSDQFGIRYATNQAFVVDAGRLTPLVGTFAARHLSTRNPLIGTPDGYSLEYPIGLEFSGEIPHFDYRAAVVSLPEYHEIYVPTPTAHPRPAIGVGYTPFTGLRVGASYTAGSYLNNSYTARLRSRGGPWKFVRPDRAGARDFSYAVGYLETHAEYARGSYEVPGKTGTIAGPTYYGEVKYTLTPRFYVAGRIERNDYPFIRAFGTSWVGKLTDFVDGEVGVGYRLSGEHPAQGDGARRPLVDRSRHGRLPRHRWPSGRVPVVAVVRRAKLVPTSPLKAQRTVATR